MSYVLGKTKKEFKQSKEDQSPGPGKYQPIDREIE